MKWLYIYRDGKYKLVNAKTRSWEKAEQKACEVRDAFDPIRQLQRRLEAQSSVDKSQIEIATAVDQFLKEVHRAEATRAKYKLTLARLLKWCATLEPLVFAIQKFGKVPLPIIPQPYQSVNEAFSVCGSPTRVTVVPEQVILFISAHELAAIFRFVESLQNV